MKAKNAFCPHTCTVEGWKTAADEPVHTPADMAQPTGQTMSAMMGADLGHQCALEYGDGSRELPREHWRKRAIAGCTTRRSACGMAIMGAARRQDDRDRELEVIAVETGAGREAFLPVIRARPSRIAK